MPAGCCARRLPSGAKVVVTGEAELLRDARHAAVDLLGAGVRAALPRRVGAPRRCWPPRPSCWPTLPRGTPHQEVLVNLGAAVPEGFERFERLIELVAQEDGDRQQARRAGSTTPTVAMPSCATTSRSGGG